MSKIGDILSQQAVFEPEADFDLFLRQVPAKWAVYLLCDAGDQPIQLLSVKNLRYSLKHRLGGEETIGLSKRVNYREIVRRICWRRVDSPLEADWVYHDAARQVFPRTYQGMIGFRPAWFVHVNPEAAFPRYAKTIDLTSKPGKYFGPFEDKHAAYRLIEHVEDWFDLCRYYNILTESPHGRACAYKEMGKCPAPCDGSISIKQYRRMIDWSASVLADPQPFIREHKRRMEQAAVELNFETAGKIKVLVEQVSHLGKGPFRHLRRLEDFAYVSLQSGPKVGLVKVFLIVRGVMEEIACLIGPPARPGEILREILIQAEAREKTTLDEKGVERIGIIANHLFSPKQTQGIFLPMESISESALAKGYKDLVKQKQPEDTTGEGVVKELQSMGE